MCIYVCVCVWLTARFEYLYGREAGPGCTDYDEYLILLKEEKMKRLVCVYFLFMISYLWLWLCCFHRHQKRTTSFFEFVCYYCYYCYICVFFCMYVFMIVVSLSFFWHECTKQNQAIQEEEEVCHLYFSFSLLFLSSLFLLFFCVVIFCMFHTDLTIRWLQLSKQETWTRSKHSDKPNLKLGKLSYLLFVPLSFLSFFLSFFFCLYSSCHTCSFLWVALLCIPVACLWAPRPSFERSFDL